MRDENNEVIENEEATKNDEFVEQYLQDQFRFSRGDKEAFLTVNHFLKVVQDIAGLSTLGTIEIDDLNDDIVYKEKEEVKMEEVKEEEDEETIEEDKIDMVNDGETPQINRKRNVCTNYLPCLFGRGGADAEVEAEAEVEQE